MFDFAGVLPAALASPSCQCSTKGPSRLSSIPSRVCEHRHLARAFERIIDGCQWKVRLLAASPNAQVSQVLKLIACCLAMTSTILWKQIKVTSPLLQCVCCRCSMSGALCNDLVACPWWKEDTRRNKFCLEGVVAMSSQLMQARENLLDDQPLQESLWTVQSINGWAVFLA